MDLLRARFIVESLSAGICPVSGLELPDGDSCASEEVQEALTTILAHCSIASTDETVYARKQGEKLEKARRRNLTKERYSKQGMPWTKQEEAYLLSLHRTGMPIYRIASIMHRSPNAISARLKKQK